MRNTATYDDIGFEEPACRTRTRTRMPRGTSKKKRKKSRRFRVDMQKVARYAAIGMSATVGLGIMINALMLQKGHHPAPLFAASIALPDPAPRTVPIPPAAPAALHASDAQDVQTANSAAAPLPAKRMEAPAKANGDDPIGRLLKTSAGSQTSPLEKSDPIRILGVQEALVNLGYDLKPNGIFGPATKKAIEGFEKDKGLPINGEITRRLVKIISAESGKKID